MQPTSGVEFQGIAWHETSMVLNWHIDVTPRHNAAFFGAVHALTAPRAFMYGGSIQGSMFGLYNHVWSMVH